MADVDPQVLAYLQSIQAQQPDPQVQAYLQDQQVRAYLAADQAKKQVPDLLPSELNTYSNQQSDLDQGYGQQSAQNAYARANQQANYQAQVQQTQQQQTQQREQLPGQYAHRGLLNSGIYGQALQNYQTNVTNQNDTNARANAQALGQNDLGQQQAQQSYTSATANLASQKAARRADLASQLRAVQ